MRQQIPSTAKTIVVIFIILPLIIFAQDKWHLLPERSGKWTYSYHNEPYGPNAEKNYKLTPTELTTIKQKLATLAEALHKNPEVSNPVGYDAVATGSLYGYDETAPRTSFTQAEINLKFYSLWGDNAGNVKRYWGEAPDIDCYINNIRPLACSFLLKFLEPEYEKDVEYKNSAQKLKEIFIRPEITKEIAPGITAYADGTIVISNPDKPYWIPVNIGQLYDLNIACSKPSDIKYNAPQGQGVWEVLKTEKESLSPKILEMPAYYGKMFQNSILQLSNIENHFPYMRLNPDYFDKSLPKSAIQIITLRANTSIFQDGNDCSGDDAAQTARCKFAGSIDYGALIKLLNP